MTDPVAVAALFAKSAQTGSEPAYLADLRAKGINDVGQMALAALGIGIAARGGAGLYNMVRRRVSPPKARYPGAIMTQLPYPVLAASPAASGVAGDAAEALPAGGAGGAGGAGEEEKTAGITDKASQLWYYPAMAGAGMAGLYGGWKGMDMLLDRRRKADQDQKLQEAKTEFQKSMLSGYGQPKLAAERTAGDELGEALDALFSSAEKQAADKKATLQDMFGKGVGAYAGFYALPMGALGAALAYNKAKKSNREAVLDKAMKERTRRAYNARPSEILAVPQPVPQSFPQTPDLDPEGSVDA